MMNDRIVLLAVLELLENACTIERQSARIAELEAAYEKLDTEHKKLDAEYKKLKADDIDPKVIERKFNFWVENGVFPEYYRLLNQ